MSNLLYLPPSTIVREVFTDFSEAEDELCNQTRNRTTSFNSDSGFSDCSTHPNDQVVGSLVEQKQMLHYQVLSLTVQNKLHLAEISDLREKLSNQTPQNLRPSNKPIDDNIQVGTVSLSELQEEAKKLRALFHNTVTNMRKKSLDTTSRIPCGSRKERVEMLENVTKGLDDLFQVVHNKIANWEADQRALKAELQASRLMLEKLGNQAMNFHTNEVTYGERWCPSTVPNAQRNPVVNHVPIFVSEFEYETNSNMIDRVNSSESNFGKAFEELRTLPPVPALNFPLGGFPTAPMGAKATKQKGASRPTNIPRTRRGAYNKASIRSKEYRIMHNEY